MSPRGWKSTEQVLESGGFESRQRVFLQEAVVEPSEAGARLLGTAYWNAVERESHGIVRAVWTVDGGRLRLLRGVSLLRFGPAQLLYDDDAVSCRYAVAGGLLALRPGGSVTLAQRIVGALHEVSVTVEEYAPRLAARAGAPSWTGAFYARVQMPFHAAVSRRYFDLLARARPG